MHELVDVGGAAEESVLEAVRGLGKGGEVGGEILEGGLGEKVLFAEPPVGPSGIGGGGVHNCWGGDQWGCEVGGGLGRGFVYISHAKTESEL